MNSNIYERKNINKLILTFSIPSIFSLIIEMLTSVIDTVFAGNIGTHSSYALTSMGIISPILTMFTALQTLFAVSTSVIIAKHLNDNEYLNKYFSIGFIMSLIVSMTTSILFFLFLNKILIGLGAKDEVLTLASTFLKIQLISNIFSSCGYTLTGCIRAFGYPKVEFIIVTSSVIINIFFNMILTFGFSMGIKGIAIATLLSEIICAFVAFLWLSRKKLWFKMVKINIKEFLLCSYEMFKIGIAQTIIQMMAGVSGFILNTSLLNFGNFNYVASWNIVQKIYMLMLMPIVGISQGVQTILAYFSTNNENSKIKKTTILTIKYCIFYSIIATFIIFIFGGKLVSLFGGDNSIHTISVTILKIIFITFSLTGILYTNMTLLQVTNREFSSILLAITRQVFTIVPLVLLLPIITKSISASINPALSIFIAIPLSDLISIFILLLIK